MANEKKLEFTPNEYMQFASDFIKSNEKLIDEGKMPIALNVEGEKGIGKTECHYTIALENGYHLCKINFGQFEMVGDLLGYAAKEFEMKNSDGDILWCTENMIPINHAAGYTKTGLTKTIPCPPEWVTGLPEKTLLFADDFSRANPLIVQATMELNKKYLLYK